LQAAHSVNALLVSGTLTDVSHRVSASRSLSVSSLD
jgi:hypothetical protein